MVLQIFRTVNHTRYGKMNIYTWICLLTDHLDDTPTRTFILTSTRPLHEDAPPSTSTAIKPRRELFWQPVTGRDTDIRKISQEYPHDTLGRLPSNCGGLVQAYHFPLMFTVWGSGERPVNFPVRNICHRRGQSLIVWGIK